MTRWWVGEASAESTVVMVVRTALHQVREGLVRLGFAWFDHRRVDVCVCAFDQVAKLMSQRMNTHGA